MRAVNSSYDFQQNIARFINNHSHVDRSLKKSKTWRGSDDRQFCADMGELAAQQFAVE